MSQQSRETAIVVEQAFSNAVTEVWNAITLKEEMKHWFFDNIPDFKAEVGFSTEFNVDAGERSFFHLWEIIEVVSKYKIVYDWRYEGYVGKGIVTFEITEESTAVHLKLTAAGMETFPQDIPEFSRESCEGGWNYFIKERLVSYLDAKTNNSL